MGMRSNYPACLLTSTYYREEEAAQNSLCYCIHQGHSKLVSGPPPASGRNYYIRTLRDGPLRATPIKLRN